MMNGDEHAEFVKAMKNITTWITVLARTDNEYFGMDEIKKLETLADAYLKLSKAYVLREIDPKNISSEVLTALK